MPPLCGSTELSRLEAHQVPAFLRGRCVTLRKRRVIRLKYAEPAPNEFRLPMVPELSQRAIGGHRRIPLLSRPVMCTFSARDSRVENARLRRNDPPEVYPLGDNVSPNGDSSEGRSLSPIIRKQSRRGRDGPVCRRLITVGQLFDD